MNAAQDLRTRPSDVSPDILRQIEVLVHDRRRALLVGPTGDRIELPDALNNLRLFVVDAMRRQQAVFVMPEDEALTTQGAARFLGMSRLYLLRLLDAGKIPFHRVGTHRRVLLRDVRAYQAVRDGERRARLDGLSRAVAESGVND